MNGDDQFEQRLQRQPLREMPSAWREEILSAAHKTESSHHRSPERLAAQKRGEGGWRARFWPHPTAWGALAAVWLVILGLHFTAHETTINNFARHSAPPSREMRELLREQERLFAELVGPIEKPDADRPRGVAPRSQRRETFLNA